MADQKLTRIAIVSSDKCKPKKCRQECKKSCPVVKTGKLCIEVTPASKIAFISEELCIGCGICVKKCPFEAIQIINLPKDLDKDTTHRYGPNTFKLHRLPVPRPGQVLGLVGTNGIGKSTALKVLAGKLKPNLGRFNNPPDWQEILTYFRGSELQNYFTRILEDNLKPADIYLIDEPSAYLDSEQRIVASKVIKRFILHAKKTAFVVEHDFIMATYLADRVIVYEGKPSIDCVANSPQSLLTGMNLFLSHLDITFRRDPTNYRPRINKLDSTKDREQKSAGSYYYLDD
ncbi:UNVERIFIED_CONTAM: ABC transporter E family member 2 [Sesamum radiatum]|uniref:ABC transporter E family member 2 n=1 Tax=Sesamum radiatum TaxID=300843 RepID=A0AAW2L263_SESRA